MNFNYAAALLPLGVFLGVVVFALCFLFCCFAML